MEFSVDSRTLDKDIANSVAALEAVFKTLDVGGRAEVVCSRRVKLPWERRSKRKGRTGKQTPNGWVIANMLVKQGHDPFVFPSGQDIEVANIISEEIAESIVFAAKTKTPATSRVRNVLIAAAMELAEVARNRVESGKLGTNTGKWARRKERLVKAGYGLKRSVGRLGLWTGRFASGIRWRWRKGFRPTGTGE